MTVHDEILALCAEMHTAGERLTYNGLLARRGGGSRRDIARALRVWHAQRARLLGETALDLPDDIREEGGAFGARMWVRMADLFADRIRDVQTEVVVSAYHAEQEIAHLHELLSDSLNKIDQLEAKLAHLTGGVS